MLSQITDHAARAVARLLFQFRDKSGIAGLMSVIGAGVQEAEDGIYSLLATRQIAVAQGAVLDQIGELVGAPARGPRSDAQYRTRIQLQIAINKGQGKLSTIYDVAGLVVTGWDSAATIITESLTDYLAAVHTPIAGYTISNPDSDNSISEAIDLARILKFEVNPAGVHGIVLSHNQSLADSFGFENGPGLGFNDGKLAGAYDGNQ